MRIIVYGLGAVGGVIAAQLSFSGYPVIGIARGRLCDPQAAARRTIGRLCGGACISEMPAISASVITRTGIGWLWVGFAAGL